MAPAKRGAPASTKQERPKKSAVRHNGELTHREKRALNIERHRALSAQAYKEYNTETPKPEQLRAAMVDKNRPTEYDAALADEICMLFATDAKMSLTRLNADARYPTVFHFYDWMASHPDTAAKYARAREAQFDLQAEEIEEWTANPMTGTVVIERDTPDGLYTETRRADNVDRARLRVDTRKWVLSKLRPKKYGLQPLEVEGNDALKDLLGAFRARSKEIEHGDS